MEGLSMTKPATILDAGKQIEAIANGRARKDNPDGKALGEGEDDEPELPAEGKLTAIPNEAKVESANDPA